MTVIKSTVLIERPKQEVFDFLSDLRNELKWNPGWANIKRALEGATTPFDGIEKEFT